MAGTLYVVATPIGNLQDLTLRAAEVLGRVELVACEDTRHTGKLLHHHGIKTRTVSCHEHNERERVPQLLKHLKEGADLAIVTDAGTPGLSDPGFRLVRAARAEGVRVETVPGPSAVVAALSVSGLPTDAFTFIGFLPARKSARHKALLGLAAEPRTLVFYEAPHRLQAALEDMVEVLGGDRPCFLARELTKIHEEHLEGTLREMALRFAGLEQVKGEVTLVVGGPAGEAGAAASVTEMAAAVVRVQEKEGISKMDAIKSVAHRMHLPKSAVYDAVLEEE